MTFNNIFIAAKTLYTMQDYAVDLILRLLSIAPNVVLLVYFILFLIESKNIINRSGSEFAIKLVSFIAIMLSNWVFNIISIYDDSTWILPVRFVVMYVSVLYIIMIDIVYKLKNKNNIDQYGSNSYYNNMYDSNMYGSNNYYNNNGRNNYYNNMYDNNNYYDSKYDSKNNYNADRNPYNNNNSNNFYDDRYNNRR